MWFKDKNISSFFCQYFLKLSIGLIIDFM